MRPHYFNSDMRIAMLHYAAGGWYRTPWGENSESRGVAVACHNLPRAIYMQCGALPSDFPAITGSPKDSQVRASVMEKFLDGRSEFRRLEPGEALIPGDLLGLQIMGLRVYRFTDHLAVLLAENWFTHVLKGKNTDRDLIHVPPWSQALRAAWRPMNPEPSN